MIKRPWKVVIVGIGLVTTLTAAAGVLQAAVPQRVYAQSYISNDGGAPHPYIGNPRSSAARMAADEPTYWRMVGIPMMAEHFSDF